MSLIKLMILDDDDEYSFNLCNSLTHNFSETLLVNYCSNSFNVEEWIKKIDPDIILTCEKYYAEVRKLYQKSILILSSGKSSSGVSDIPSIYKYKDVNKIAGDIINSYINAGNVIKTSGEKSTKVLSVYSASGNVGKTSIAVGISTICSLSGLKVFYLNLEQFQSTNFFFSSESEFSMSEIIYYLKDQDKNLVSKLSTMRCQDPSTGVFYFKEANNSFEINDLTPGDINFLINSLRECGQYDIIVIDTDSRLDSNSLEVLNAADEIIYIFIDEEICLHKTKAFLESLKKLSNSSTQYTYLYHKIIYVANKVSSQGLSLFYKFLSNEKTLSEIQFQEHFNSKNFRIMGGPEITNALKKITGRYVI